MNSIVINKPQLLVSISDPALLTKLKNAIKMLNGVSAISVLKPKKSDLELAHEDVAAGRVTHWNSVDEMFDTILVLTLQNVLTRVSSHLRPSCVPK